MGEVITDMIYTSYSYHTYPYGRGDNICNDSTQIP